VVPRPPRPAPPPPPRRSSVFHFVEGTHIPKTWIQRLKPPKNFSQLLSCLWRHNPKPVNITSEQIFISWVKLYRRLRPRAPLNTRKIKGCALHERRKRNASQIHSAHLSVSLFFSVVYQLLEEMFQTRKGKSRVVRVHATKGYRICGNISASTEGFKVNPFIFPQKLNISFHSALRLWDTFNTFVITDPLIPLVSISKDLRSSKKNAVEYLQIFFKISGKVNFSIYSFCKPSKHTITRYNAEYQKFSFSFSLVQTFILPAPAGFSISSLAWAAFRKNESRTRQLHMIEVTDADTLCIFAAST
jgi:hypothetical protein